MNLSYGSGGWCMVITNQINGRTYSAYSYDVVEAGKEALRKYDEYKRESTEQEDITTPELKFNAIAAKMWNKNA